MPSRSCLTVPAFFTFTLGSGVSGHEKVPTDGQQKDHDSVAAGGLGARSTGSENFTFHCPRSGAKDRLGSVAAASSFDTGHVAAGAPQIPAFPHQ